MGVLVFVLAILPLSGGHSLHIMRAESPGPTTTSLSPQRQDGENPLRHLYRAYACRGPDAVHRGHAALRQPCAFVRHGRHGGFSIRNLSVGAYGSAYFDYVIGVFMILFSLNFNAYFFLLIKKYKDFFKSEELRVYLGIVAAAVALVTLNLYRTVYPSLSAAFRYAFFQVSSIITTTGFATADFNLLPQLSRVILLTVMFCGACAGSTGGGIKVSRIIMCLSTQT
jgi:trk system potassium uptake protein TrkH